MSSTREKGAVTLLVTSALLIAALILSLASFKAVFYQIKRAQNEFKVREAHWHSEAGIECAYAYVYAFPDQLAVLSSANTWLADECKPKLKLESLYIEALANQDYVIHANSSNYQLNRRFSYREVNGLKQLSWVRGGWYVE
ncbi:hypothetical protein TW81_00445 [Vibrio galatheae]|uniref:Uncharacterized protein n=1 Tax=Vibrio galatheae TaxID=579748 RepID=A0A0F4NQA5_9VIBR|nr:hypothetical protein [Vibrio galatheae]KJY85340.1 hypothetical protein TW81_00445 [Vibrio galatheae]